MATHDQSKEFEKMSSSSQEKEILVAALTRLTKALEGGTKCCEKGFQEFESMEDFVRFEMKQMTELKNLPARTIGLFFAYKECMSSLSVKTWKELEELFSRHCQDKEVSSCIGVLTAIEEKYDNLMEKIHEEVVKEEGKNAFEEIVTTGKILPQNLSLIETTSGEPTRLDSYWKESKFTLFILRRHFGCFPCADHLKAVLSQQEKLAELGCQVVHVARATRESALEYIEDTKCPCPLLLDYDLTLYRHLGLKRSIKNVYAIATMINYAERLVAGIPMSKIYDSDDSAVMGGDYVVDSSGKLIYAYSHRSYKDRPSVDSLLEALSSD